MTRNNADFQNGLHHGPQPEGSDWTPKYAGETLYHGSPHKITDGVVVPGSDGRAWATNHPDEATVYGKYKDEESTTHVYEVKPLDPNEVVGVYGPRRYEDSFVKHFHSGKGFKVVKQIK